MISTDPRSSIPAESQHLNSWIPRPSSRTMPSNPESRPGSPSGWYEASLLSDIQKENQSESQNPSLEATFVAASQALGSRERVKSISRSRWEQRCRAESVRDYGVDSVVSSHFAAPSLPPASRNVVAKGPIDSKSYNEGLLAQGFKISVEVPGAHREGADGPASEPFIGLPPTTPLVLKAPKNAPLDRLQIEDAFKPDAVSPTENQDPENGLAGQRSYKLKPLERVAETFFLLLPVLAAVYLLTSCCVPTTWWRERLSIARVTLNVKEATTEVPPSLLIGAFGWCIHEVARGTRCSRAKFTYSMDEFFALGGYGESGPTPIAFVAPTMKAFISLIPSALLACAALFFVLLHVYHRCLQNDRRREAGKWQHLVILAALLSTIASSVVMKVFAIQLADGMIEDTIVENGAVPLLVLASLILLSIALAASVIPPFVARARSQYMYHVRNIEAQKARAEESDQEDSLTFAWNEDVKRASNEDANTDRSVVNRLTIMIGKRATRFLGPAEVDGLECIDGEQKIALPPPYIQEPPRSAIPEEADLRRKSVLKRLTLNTQSVVR